MARRGWRVFSQFVICVGMISLLPGCGGPADLHKYIAYGASPRASQCLVLGAKARALLAGRFHVDFADLKALAAPVLRHRLVLNFLARADKVDADMLVGRLLAHVPQEA